MRSADYYHPVMEKEKSKILVIDTQTKQVLMECPLEEAGKAHEFAAQMEDIGLEVSVINPTLTETLTEALGLSSSQKDEYLESLQQEIEHHEGSCCFEELKHQQSKQIL
jgi:hypothetical protein